MNVMQQIDFARLASIATGQGDFGHATGMSSSAQCRSGELKQRLFYGGSVTAVVGSGSPVRRVCDALASELSTLGKSVVIISLDEFVRAPEPPDPRYAGFVSTFMPNVWLWPPEASQKTTSLGLVTPVTKASWFSCLKPTFDSVLLDARELESSLATAAIADCAVLAVESRKTLKRQIVQDQRVLQSMGIKLAGCVLVGGEE